MSTEDAVDAAHGFFQFANCSDSDSDDGLFTKQRDRTVSFDASKIHYTPKIDQDGWFDRAHSIPVNQWLSQHGGLDEVAFTVQRLYFKEQYTEAVALCKQAVEAFVAKYKQGLRVASIREIIEVGALAAIQADDLQTLEFFYSWYSQCGGMNPGYNRFLSEVLTKLGRKEAALEQLVLYLEQRKQDAKVWELIGRLLVDIALECREATEHTTLLRLAMGSFNKARLIIYGRNSWGTNPRAMRQQKMQSDELRSAITSALAHLVSKDTELGMLQDEDIWVLCRSESEQLDVHSKQALLESSVDSFGRSIGWICQYLESESSADDDDNQDVCESEKNVEQL
ncbi:hypothetical protein GGI07_003180 [Coemansia sp. Benny D115]|nr:hypothetical protein GGI07_003180 [Coemansia sp. Benny D115]